MIFNIFFYSLTNYRIRRRHRTCTQNDPVSTGICVEKATHSRSNGETIARTRRLIAPRRLGIIWLGLFVVEPFDRYVDWTGFHSGAISCTTGG